MKKNFFILIFFVIRLYSQVNPPDFRCLQILANGDTKLTWIPINSSINSFFSYEIWRATSKNGPYNLKGTVNSFSTTNFIDIGAPSSNLSLYYYVLTKYNTGGTQSSINSDTLKTIFLNLNSIPGAVDVKLNYNTIHQPKLASTSSSFAIYKEYPLGTWTVFGNTANSNYADTISVCSSTINYQIKLNDNSGCVSTSAILGGFYHDISAPDSVQIDSISVLPNGNTTVAWKIPRQNDIVKYQIYLFNGTAQTLAIIPGRQTKSYTYSTSSAKNNTVSLFVAAIDSCNNLGGFDKRPVSLFLKTKYDYCAYQTTLNWNEYINLQNGLLEYRIYYSENGSTFNQIASTQQTSYIHKYPTPGKNLCYFIRVINKTKNVTSTSNKVCFFSTQTPSSNYVYIKTASVLSDSETKLTILVDSSKIINGLTILRSNTGINYSNIGFINYNGAGNYSFVDKSTLNKTQNYFYKVAVKDSCGNNRITSNPVKTMLLNIKEDDDNLFVKHLSWINYEGFLGGIGGYKIYRIDNQFLNATEIGFTNFETTTFTDTLDEVAPNGSKIEYVVECIENTLNNYGIKSSSFSNGIDVYMEANLFIPNAFMPNGINKTWRPRSFFVDKLQYELNVFNRWGELVFHSNDDTEEWDGKNCLTGIYVYVINYKNSKGKTQQTSGKISLIK